ncbi:MAG: SDR family NAD(P)-dependent oxidoreductase [Lachnospiraceae bacterium]|jgi:3-oxoacyl-[acyl-carrier protein] reductase|nr:SDR family NAD(P)-dependent oxidoreductase [Lachnospiraceae bacterium]
MSSIKTALITGASRGIGKAIALRLAKEGFRLVICAKNEALLINTRKELLALGAPCLAVAADVSDFAACKELFNKTQASFGPVNVLVNNAGVSHIGLLQDMSEAEWNGLVGVNLSSVFYCCRLAIPSMVTAKSGRILNISSVWGSVGASCEAAYSATKGGVNALTKALAKELAPAGIQVNALACGAIDTDMNRFLSEEERNALALEIPAGRLGTVAEAADMAWRLLSAPDYLTGQIVTLDGGWI